MSANSQTDETYVSAVSCFVRSQEPRVGSRVLSVRMSEGEVVMGNVPPATGEIIGRQFFVFVFFPSRVERQVLRDVLICIRCLWRG